jgi:hypothetical protein
MKALQQVSPESLKQCPSVTDRKMLSPPHQ